MARSPAAISSSAQAKSSQLYLPTSGSITMSACLRQSGSAVCCAMLKERPKTSTTLFGIAGGMTGLYALQGPGGWPLIGRTSFILFDAAADDPFVLVPGSKVVFVPVAAM